MERGIGADMTDMTAVKSEAPISFAAYYMSEIQRINIYYIHTRTTEFAAEHRSPGCGGSPT